MIQPPVDFRSLVILKSSRYPIWQPTTQTFFKDEKYGKTNYNKICLRLNDEFCEDLCTTSPYGFDNDPDSDYIIFTKIKENVFKAELFIYYDEPHTFAELEIYYSGEFIQYMQFRDNYGVQNAKGPHTISHLSVFLERAAGNTNVQTSGHKNKCYKNVDTYKENPYLGKNSYSSDRLKIIV